MYTEAKWLKQTQRVSKMAYREKAQLPKWDSQVGIQLVPQASFFNIIKLTSPPWFVCHGLPESVCAPIAPQCHRRQEEVLTINHNNSVIYSVCSVEEDQDANVCSSDVLLCFLLLKAPILQIWAKESTFHQQLLVKMSKGGLRNEDGSQQAERQLVFRGRSIWWRKPPILGETLTEMKRGSRTRNLWLYLRYLEGKGKFLAFLKYIFTKVCNFDPVYKGTLWHW